MSPRPEACLLFLSAGYLRPLVHNERGWGETILWAGTILCPPAPGQVTGPEYRQGLRNRHEDPSTPHPHQEDPKAVHSHWRSVFLSTAGGSTS